MTLLAKNLKWRPAGHPSPLLDVPEFRATPGDMIGIVGPSGSGKSTFLRLLVLLEALESGTVSFDGVVVTADTVLAYRRHVTLVAQQPVPVEHTIGENLEFARRFGGDQAMSLTEQCEALQTLGLRPDDAWFKRSFTSLSGGEQQRVALVRAVTSRPRVLLLDEPTSALDRETESQVEGYVRAFQTEDPSRIVIWVSHNPDQLERMNAREFAIGGRA